MAEPGGDEQKKRRQRNLAIALLIGAFVLIIYIVTMLKIGGTLGGQGA